MKKVTFKVSPKEKFSLANWLKEVNRIPCRMYVRLGDDSMVEIQDIEESLIDTAIDLVSDYCMISAAEIDNTSGNQEVKEEKLAVEKDVVLPKMTIREVTQPEELNPKKVEFVNKHVEDCVNRFLRTAYAALASGKASEEKIGHYISSAMSNIYFNHLAEKKVKVEIGDVVDCNYGYNVEWEINGIHVSGIVCDIIDDTLAFVVPITKATGENVELTRSYLEFIADRDVIYDELNYAGGTALVDKGRYIRIERVNSVIGKTTPTFLEKVLYRLSTAFDFTSSQNQIAEYYDYNENYIDSETESIVLLEKPEVVKKANEAVVEEPVEEDEAAEEVVEEPVEEDETAEEVVEEPVEEDEAAEEVVEEPVEEDEAAEEVVEESVEEDEVAEEVVEESVKSTEADKKVDVSLFKTSKTKSTNKKPGVEETALMKYIGSYLDELDKSKPFEGSVETFLDEIGMLQDELIVQAFWVACNTAKITYHQIACELNSLHPDIDVDTIEETLKGKFKIWLEDYPQLAKECPKISFTSLLKAFARRFE